MLIETLTSADNPAIPEGCSIEASYDAFPENPRGEWSLWTIATTHRRYQPIDEEYHAGCVPDDADLAVPVWLYDHSGTCYKAGADDPFSCRWDSGRIGTAYLPAGTIDREYVKFGQTEAEGRANARKSLDAELEEYTAWVNGEVYRFALYGPDGEELGYGCGGFTDHDYMMGEAIAELQAERADQIEAAEREAAERRHWAERDVVTA